MNVLDSYSEDVFRNKISDTLSIVSRLPRQSREKIVHRIEELS